MWNAHMGATCSYIYIKRAGMKEQLCIDEPLAVITEATHKLNVSMLQIFPSKYAFHICIYCICIQ